MLDPLTVTLMQPALTEMEAMTVNAMMATLGMEHTVKVHTFYLVKVVITIFLCLFRCQ